jgi:hypothetical protein
MKPQRRFIGPIDRYERCSKDPRRTVLIAAENLHKASGQHEQRVAKTFTGIRNDLLTVARCNRESFWKPSKDQLWMPLPEKSSPDDKAMPGTALIVPPTIVIALFRFVLTDASKFSVPAPTWSNPFT